MKKIIFILMILFFLSAFETVCDEETGQQVKAQENMTRQVFSYNEKKIKRSESYMVFVQGGTFYMGNKIGSVDERPVHAITLRSFLISKYEVTFKQYDIFCDATGKKKPVDRGWGRGKRPVIFVSWYDAVAYCNWLSKINGFSPCYNIKGKKSSCNFYADGYRLPTEAEWEFAAKGGNKSKGYNFSGSNNMDDVSWNKSNSLYKTNKVGKLEANELGISDLSGNVWEWCWDYYDRTYYTISPEDNPFGPQKGKNRILRGGSWYNPARYQTNTVRDYANPESKDDYFGFRIVRTILD